MTNETTPWHDEFRERHRLIVMPQTGQLTTQ